MNNANTPNNPEKTNVAIDVNTAIKTVSLARMDEIKQKEKLIDIQVSGAMSLMRRNNLDSESLKEVESIFNLHYQRLNLTKLKDEKNPMVCNMLIKAECPADGQVLATQIAKLCGRNGIITISETNIMTNGTKVFPVELIEDNGTGKTTVARLLADRLFAMKVLKTNKVTVLERKDLVGAHIGETEEKTKDALSEGYGGVIFIDEAYSLFGGSDNDFGSQAVNVLLTAMMEHKGDTAFVLAGYPREMKALIESNSGFASRFDYKLMFPDYKLSELTEIFKRLCTKSGFKISRKALDRFSDVCDYFSVMDNFGNGRFCDQVFQQTLIKRAKRSLTNVTRINQDDIPKVSELIEVIAGCEHMHNPDEITDEERLRTAYHELGHAIASIHSGRVPECITIKDQIGSLGHVTLDVVKGNMTEEQLRSYLVICISGRNAEKLLLGNSSTGCSSDFKQARDVAEAMVSEYAMGELGVTTAMDFIKEADRESTKLLTRYRRFIETEGRFLLKKRQVTGEELKAKLDMFHLAA